MMIDGHTRQLGLIGNPVRHTLSPVIHNTLSKELQDNNVYCGYEVEAGRLDAAIKGAWALGFLGLNVTVPYKNEVMSLLEDCDEDAKAIGAVNTLVRGTQGYIGYNTDMPGLYRACVSNHINIINETVIILGAGGAAKAVLYMCMKYGAKRIYLLNRTKVKAEELGRYYNEMFQKDIIQAMDINHYNEIKEVDCLAFQCTSCGLSPKVNECVIEDQAFYKKVNIGFDLIYNPAKTQFMKNVEEAEGKAYNGLKMLLYQGVIAYELWHGIESIPENIVNKVEEKLYEAVYQ